MWHTRVCVGVCAGADASHGGCLKSLLDLPTGTGLAARPSAGSAVARRVLWFRLVASLSQTQCWPPGDDDDGETHSSIYCVQR